MNNKGLTLIEIIAVLVVLSLISIIVFPGIMNIMEENKTTGFETQKASIKESAKSYVADHVGVDMFLTDNEEIQMVSLKTLIDNGYLSGSTKNAKTGKEFDLNQSNVKIKQKDNKFTYEITIIDYP